MKIRRDSQYQLEEVLDWAVHLVNLQAVFREFDSTAAPSEESLIRYFWEYLRLSIWAQLDNWQWDLDTWDKVVEKAIDIKAKASLQPHFGTREIDSRYAKRYRPSVNKDKDDAYWEQHDKAFNRKNEKAISYNPLSFANQPQT